ncbi:MAG: YgiQ family radical SAM protein [Clostridium sp.]|nr:YgiQ family radical SAM protein [Clostridium sp.]MCM1460854.1 YgiQ family radical SAM protein [Bacteroides sp.]
MEKLNYKYNAGFLPLNKTEMELKGWEQPDFVYVIGDAYVDHPSFGHAIISRILELYGYKVAIISQPDWKNPASIDIYGRPRLAYLVAAGNMDSMVNHYSVSKKRRTQDAYTPGGVMGKRPDYATVVYCNLIRRKYKDVPIVIGGIEASLRRLAHYDYWSNHMKHSILVDSQADILIFGMGEKAIIEVAEALDSGIDARDITFIDGTAYRTKTIDHLRDYITLPDYDMLLADKLNYAKSFQLQYDNTDHYTAKTLVEKYNDHMYVVQNRPAAPLTENEMDRVYSLNYMRTYHPSYEALGGVPAISEVKFSIVSNRGCFGGCSFCALTFHQGRIIQTRSDKSILQEAEKMVWEPDFKGYIHDVGGPTANFRLKACKKQEKYGVCKNRQCLFPKPCENLIADHSSYLALLRKLRELPNVKKVFIRSGIRFDYLMADKNDEFFYELCKYHVSGQLKVAPEHVSDNVLRKMGKPGNDVFQAFCDKYKKINEELGMKQYMVPYLMSSHPGSTMKDAVKLAEYLRDLGYMPEQVQDFYPTPSTISTCMYYTGVDPRTMEKVYVPVSPHEKAMQRALIQYRNPQNYDLVHEALVIAKRTDLIGYDKKCLIRPRKNDEAFKTHRKENGEWHRADNVKYGGGFTENKENMKNGDGKRKKKTIRNIHKKKKK